MTTKDIIEAYYKGLNQKKNWESAIADNMVFNGPNTKTNGKDAYIQATNRFLQVVQAVQINNLIVDGGAACAVAHYDLMSRNGNTASCDIAEVFTVKNGKIESSAIFFDTVAFREFMTLG